MLWENFVLKKRMHISRIFSYTLCNFWYRESSVVVVLCARCVFETRRPSHTMKDPGDVDNGAKWKKKDAYNDSIKNKLKHIYKCMMIMINKLKWVRELLYANFSMWILLSFYDSGKVFNTFKGTQNSIKSRCRIKPKIHAIKN